MKPDELTSIIRTELRRRLRTHPMIKNHVRTPSEVNSMTKARLLELAEKLHIDLRDVRFAAILGENYGFKGRVIIPMSFDILGRKIERKLRVTLSYSPGWDYFDLEEKTVVPGEGPKWAMKLEMFAIRDSIDTSKKRNVKLPPEWVEVKDFHEDGIFCQEVFWEIEDLFDQRFQEENEKRLDASGAYSLVERENYRKAYVKHDMSERFSNLIDAIEILPLDHAE